MSQAILKKPLILVTALSALAVSCAPSEWWGEKKPAPQIIVQPASKTCADALLIVSGTPAESETAFECWAKQVGGLWNEIEGSERGALSELELKRLAAGRVLALGGDPELDNQKIQAIRKLMGFNGSLTREGMNAWISWARKHRPQMRRLYRRMVVGDGKAVTYEDFHDALVLASDALKKAQWTFNADGLGEVLAPFIPRDNPHLANAAVPMARVAVNLIAAYCPTFQDRRRISSHELAACLPAIAAHLRPGARWIEFLLNGLEAKTASPAEISLALDRLTPAVESWFAQPQLGTADPTLWFALARSMNLPVDERGALESLSWINRFNRTSTAYAIHPTLNILLYSIARDYFKGMLDGMPHFTDCTNGPVSHWMDCRPRDPSSLAPKSTAIRIALRAHNLKYASDALPFDGMTFSRIQLFNALARPVIDVYDTDGDRFLEVHHNTNRDQNEVVDAIAAAFKVLKNANFMINIVHRIKNEPIEYETTEEDLEREKINIRGLTRLATLMGDTFTPLSNDELTRKERFRRSLPRLGAKAAVEINQLQLAAVIFRIDALLRLRESYADASLVGEEAARAFTPRMTDAGPVLSRAETLRNFAAVMERNFPMLHRGCKEWGYDRTCDIVFDEVLALHIDPATNLPIDRIFPADVDIVTLVALFAEGIHNRCDINGNGRLERGGFTANSHKDEMDCVSITLASAVQRLKESAILEVNIPGFDILINGQSVISPLRGITQTALMRGTMSSLPLHFVLFPLRKYGTLGSVMALAAEFMQPEITKKIDADRGRPSPR